MENKRNKFAETFYYSWAWKKCREAYKKKASGICERCMKRGLIVPGVEVHHKVRLTPENLSDPAVTLNFDNLELLCEECHEREHTKAAEWRTDADGHVDL